MPRRQIKDTSWRHGPLFPVSLTFQCPLSAAVAVVAIAYKVTMTVGCLPMTRFCAEHRRSGHHLRHQVPGFTVAFFEARAARGHSHGRWIRIGPPRLYRILPAVESLLRRKLGYNLPCSLNLSTEFSHPTRHPRKPGN